MSALERRRLIVTPSAIQYTLFVSIHPMIEDLNALKVFLAVSTCGNMTAAAKRLGLTQSAVSQSIRQLEDNLGSVLLDRAQRPLRLTAAGMVLQRHAVSLVEDAA